MMDWHHFDPYKNELKRQTFVRAYYCDDPNMAIPVTSNLEMKKWRAMRIHDWNKGLMNEDGEIDYKKKYWDQFPNYLGYPLVTSWQMEKYE